MADDFASTTATTGVLPVGGSVSGVLEAEGDVDWFRVTLTAGQHLEVSGPSWLNGIWFYDAAGHPVNVDFFGSLSPNGLIETAGFTASTSGTYYVGVSAPGTGPQYTLTSVLGTGNNPANLSNIPVLTDGAAAAGQLTSVQVAWYAVTLAVGETVELGGPDQVVAYNGFGVELESVKRVDSDADPFTYFTAQAAGTYYFRVANYRAGPYQIDAHIFTDDYSDGVDPYGSPAEAPGNLNATLDHASGIIDTSSDVDRFDFNLVAGQTVRIRLEFTELHSFMTEVTVTYGLPLYDQGGLYAGQLRTEEAGELIFTAPTTGTYHFDVSAPYYYVGGYNVTIQTVSANAAYDGLPSIVPAIPTRPSAPTQATTVAWESAGTYFVGAGTTIYTTNIDGQSQPNTPYAAWGGSPAVHASIFPQYTAILNNAGLIRNYNDVGGLAAGVGADSVINSGSIISEVSTPYHGPAYTAFAAATGVKLGFDLNNSGRIHAGAISGNAVGIFTTSSGRTIANSGIISASATSGPDPNQSGGATAISSWNGSNVVNTASGQILAEADQQAVAINFGGTGSIENHGLIEAHLRGIYGTSIGIILTESGPPMGSTSFPTAVDVHNYGTIRADQAIVATDTSTWSTHPEQVVFNHAGGLIDGDIILGLGNDVVRNEGAILGHVDMGGDRDLFDATGGQTNGVVDLGADADTFIGGSFADFARGGTGDDILGGNGGNDLLLGGHGNDVITGGAGNDGLYGEFGADRIVTQGGDVVDGGTGGDRIETTDLTFQSIAGGAGHDVWALPTGGRTLDLGLIAASGRVSGIEEIELAGGQTAVVHSADVAALSGGASLFLSGASSDAVYLTGAWAAGSSVQFNGATYARYTLSGATVFVEAGVAVTIGNSPPTGVGLDAAAAGIAPAPGAIVGADLSTAEMAGPQALYNIQTVTSEEIWQNLRGGSVWGGEGYSIGLINYGTIGSIGSTDRGIAGPTGSAYAISTNVAEVIDNSGLIFANAFGEGNAVTYVGASRGGVVNRESGRIYAFAEEGYAIAINGAESSAGGGRPGVDNRGDIYAYSQGGFAVAIAERNSPLIANSGVIEADGGAGAIAIDLSNAGGQVINHGDIIAFSPVSSPYYSTGVVFYSQAALQNYGTISADIAIDIIGRYGYVSTILNAGTIYGLISKTYWTTDDLFGGVDLTNSGSIYGSIYLADGSSRSTITNTGYMEGNVLLGSGNDIYDGANGRLVGTLFGGAGNDTLKTGLGDDRIEGGAGADILNGGAGRDTASYAASASAVTVSLLTGTGSGGDAAGDTLSNIENLEGSAFNDALTGDANSNWLYGNAGNDALDGGSGADLLVGGLGNDVYVVDNAGDIVTELVGEGRDTVFTSTGVVIGSELRYTLSANVEDLAVSGFAGAINLFGNALANLIVGNGAVNALDGGAGADMLIGGGGNDLYFVDNIADVIIENAGEGRDTVYTSIAYYSLGDNEIEDVVITGSAGCYVVGNALANLMVGGVGADALDGGAGADFMVGGAGNDTYFVDNIGDVLVESAGGGRDTVYVALSYYSLGDNEIEDAVVATSGGAYVIGNGLANLMVGGAGADALDGGAGADFMVGGGGNDSYFVDNLGDTVIESVGEGRDTVYASISYTLGDTEVEDLALLGSGNISAGGNGLANLLVGNGGANVLWGRGGSDTLVGGAGADRFAYMAASEGGDVITDFVSGVDKIQVSAPGFGGGLTAGGAVTLRTGASPTASGTNGQFLYNTSNGQLYWDADGTNGGAAVLLATLSGAPAISASDFVVTDGSSNPLSVGDGGIELMAMSAKDADPAPEILPASTSGDHRDIHGLNPLYPVFLQDGDIAHPARLLERFHGAGDLLKLAAITPQVLPAFALDGEALIETAATGKLADGSPQVMPGGAWQGGVEPWNDTSVIEIASAAEETLDILHHERGDLGANVFDPTDFSDLAALGANPRPEWAIIEQ
ncbi:MAG: calcium-binding protein [Hyphomonadaceae bacterium]